MCGHSGIVIYIARERKLLLLGQIGQFWKIGENPKDLRRKLIKISLCNCVFTPSCLQRTLVVTLPKNLIWTKTEETKFLSFA